MTEEYTSSDLEETKWFIDLDWLDASGRSFTIMAERCLCENCRRKLIGGKGEPSADKLIKAIKDCCSTEEYYIHSEMPLMETIFRLILAAGNKPVTLADIGTQLRERRGSSPGSTSAGALYRLMARDRFYGMNQTAE